MNDTRLLSRHFEQHSAGEILVTPTGGSPMRLADALAAALSGGGLPVSNAFDAGDGSLFGSDGSSAFVV